MPCIWAMPLWCVAQRRWIWQLGASDVWTFPFGAEHVQEDNCRDPIYRLQSSICVQILKARGVKKCQNDSDEWVLGLHGTDEKWERDTYESNGLNMSWFIFMSRFWRITGGVMHDNKSFPRIFLALGYPCHPGALDGVFQWYRESLWQLIST
jgi:hypothetical protein